MVDDGVRSAGRYPGCFFQFNEWPIGIMECSQGDCMVLMLLILLVIGLFVTAASSLGLFLDLGASLSTSLACGYPLLSGITSYSPPFLAPFSSTSSTTPLLLRLLFMISPSFSLTSELFVECLALSNT